MHDEVLDEPYRLVAVDTMEDMSLCRRIGTKGDCVGDGLPRETVFQAGWNSEYIVVARHPRQWPGPANRSISEFYYVVRAVTDYDPGRKVRVVGPLNQDAYVLEKERLALPEFSKVFGSLK